MLLNFPVILLLLMTKIVRAMKFPEECSLHQMDTAPYRRWCTAKHMKLNVSKTRIIYFNKKPI
jgi:acyl-ACP thioesterase